MKNLLITFLCLLTYLAQAQDTKTPFATTPTPVAGRYAWTNNGLWIDSNLKVTSLKNTDTLNFLYSDANGIIHFRKISSAFDTTYVYAKIKSDSTIIGSLLRDTLELYYTKLKIDTLFSNETFATVTARGDSTPLDITANGLKMINGHLETEVGFINMTNNLSQVGYRFDIPSSYSTIISNSNTVIRRDTLPDKSGTLATTKDTILGTDFKTRNSARDDSSVQRAALTLHTSNTNNPHNVTLQQATSISGNTTNPISIGTITGSYFTDSIVVVGTSIEYGYGLASPSTQAWPIQLGNMIGYGVINLGVNFATYINNDSLYRRIPIKRPNLKYIIFGGPVNDANSYPTDTATYSAKIISVIDSAVNYKGWSYSDFYQQTPLFCYRNFRNNVNYPALLRYSSCIRNIVTKKGLNLIDLFSYSYSTAGYGYTQDGVHPDYKGVQYLAQFTSGYIPKTIHNSNDALSINGKVQLGDSIYHMTTNMATPGSGIMLLAKDATGREVLVSGDEYIRAANLNDIATGGGIHTTEHITTDRSVNAGTMQMYGNATNSTWLAENMFFDLGSTTGFTYKTTGFAHMLQWFGGALNYTSGGFGTAGSAVTQLIRNRFVDDGSLGLGAQGDNSSSTSISGHALQIFPTTYNIGINTNVDAGYRLDLNGSLAVRGTLYLPNLPTHLFDGYKFIVKNSVSNNIEYVTSISQSDVNNLSDSLTANRDRINSLYATVSALPIFSQNQSVTGLINGSNTVYTLPYASTTTNVSVYYNGQRLTPTVDYSVSGTTLTTTFAPVTSSVLLTDITH